MKRIFAPILLSCILQLANAQQFTLLKDINPGAASSNICYLLRIDNTLFFAATDGVNGMELWKSDGSTLGTVLVKDINAGIASSSIGYLTKVNRTLFFVANNGASGTELWKTDGTLGGTVMVKDINPGSAGSNPSSLVDVNGTLFFAANNGSTGTELWKSDGSDAGTILVKDINPFAMSSYPQSLANANGTLFFSATTSAGGAELWKSNGTAAGTVLVKDIASGANGSYPSGLVAMGSTVLFSASDGVKGNELWKSDGTAAGTALVKDIWSGAGDSYPYELKSIDGTLFFSANNGSSGSELWKSDGTTAGTLLVKDIWPGYQSGAVGNFTSLINKLIFTGNDGVHGDKTWQSDGSVSGTKVASSIADPGAGELQELVETDDKIFASISESSLGTELWAINYSSTLPLGIPEFNGKLINHDGILSWKTADDQYADEFIIERSLDGRKYSAVERIASIPGGDNHNYTFTDPDITDLGAEMIYYRLRQLDKSGHHIFSRIVALPVKGVQNTMLYPNPATDEINLLVSSLRNETMSYRIYDNSGRFVRQAAKPVSSGSNNFSIDISKLSSGGYYLVLQGSSGDKRLQFIKH